VSGRSDVLRNAQLLSEVPADELDLLSDLFRPVELKAAETFAIRGLPSPGMVVVEAGSLEVILDSTPVCSLSPGSIFAEESLVADVPAKATLRAAVDSAIGVLERSAVEERMESLPKLCAALDAAWRHRVLTARLYSIDLFRGLPDPLRVALADAFEEVDLPAGAVIAEQGKILDAFYVVREGQAEFHDDATSVPLRAGEYVGDDVLFREYPQAATVTAPYGARVLKLTKDAAMRVLHRNDLAMKSILAALEKRGEQLVL
jgi:CRP-like cAMP-binding protein